MRSSWIVLHVAGAVMSAYGVAVAAWVIADGGYTHSLGLAAAVMVAGLAYCVEAIRHGVD